MRQLLSPQYPASTNCTVENPEFLIIPGLDESSDNVHALFRREIIVESKEKITLTAIRTAKINAYNLIGVILKLDILILSYHFLCFCLFFSSNLHTPPYKFD